MANDQNKGLSVGSGGIVGKFKVVIQNDTEPESPKENSDG